MQVKILNTIPYKDGNAIVICTDRNYVDYAMVAMQSWLEHSSQPTSFFILTDEPNPKELEELVRTTISIPEKSSVEVHSIDDLVDLGDMEFHTTGYYITKAAYYRLLIPSFMPDYEKVLYLDCDICVVKPMEEIFDVDFGDGCGIAGVEDFSFFKMIPKVMKGTPGLSKLTAEQQKEMVLKYHNSYAEWYAKELDMEMDKDAKYMNSGVVMFNNPWCIENGMANRMFRLIEGQNEKNHWLYHADQDVLNSCFNGRIKWLPPEWNALWYFTTLYVRNVTMVRRKLQKKNEEYVKAMMDSACLWHYTGNKPWNKPQFNYSVASHWWKACSHTPLLQKHLAKLSPTVQEHVLESIEESCPTLDQFL